MPKNRYPSCSSSRTAAPLFEQPHRRAALRLRKRLAAACRVHGDCGQQLAELARRPGIEPAIGAPRQPRDLLEGSRGTPIVAFLEQEHGHTDEAELAGLLAQLIDIFFHAIAHIDDRMHLLLFVLLARVGQDLADLRVTAFAMDLAHQPRQGVRVAHPAAGLALVEASEIE
jgi:hypothetical protein